MAQETEFTNRTGVVHSSHLPHAHPASSCCPLRTHTPFTHVHTPVVKDINIKTTVLMIFASGTEKIKPKPKNIKNVFWSVHLFLSTIRKKKLFSFFNSLDTSYNAYISLNSSL